MQYRAAFLCAVWLAGCRPQPEPYAPPLQRKPATVPEAGKLKHFVTMNDPDAMAHVLRDVSPHLEADLFRWTGQRPLFRFVLPRANNLSLKVTFSISTETMKVTGPFSITYMVNGKLLDKARYTQPAQHTFLKPVDPAWLEAGGDTVVSMDLDKVYVAPEDGARLGVTLVSVGFVD